jgi:hypothetical protein
MTFVNPVCYHESTIGYRVSKDPLAYFSLSDHDLGPLACERQ